MENLIQLIENEIENTEMFWLLRKRTEQMIADGKGKYFAHICTGTSDEVHISHKGFGHTPKEALKRALKSLCPEN